MFKSVVVYQFTKRPEFSFGALEKALREKPFALPLPAEASSCGFVPPMASPSNPVPADELDYLELVGGLALFTLVSAVKKVKAAELQYRLNERVREIEQAEGRRVYRKERDAIKDDVIFELMPNTFPEQARARGYIDARHGLLVIEATTHAASEVVVSLLRQAAGGLPISLITPVTAFEDSATEAVRHTALQAEGEPYQPERIPARFVLGFDAALSNAEDSVVKVANQDLTNQELMGYIAAGYRVNELSLETRDEGVGIRFRVGAKLIIKAIKPNESFVLSVEGDTAEVQEDALYAARIHAELLMFADVMSMVVAGLVDMMGGYEEGGAPCAWAPEVVGDLGARLRSGVERRGAAADDGGDADPLLSTARAHVIDTQKGSISSLQRHLRVGYNRAARLIEALEQAGVVSPIGHDGCRLVLRRAEHAV